ncbi:DUF1918 domain-containing protein [Phytoactinopolyspora alkaliphila]|uniref:DUF1918 domain-containing protein n=1 Tax=Phytoactinopolyspora alkaliphila TaxID=1783498 RepID=A0A6N9YS21_9ACTN|nr:DUF1918 domain-containing protein [Phytoactinopolyspora alkaliphila]NED97628.1 DUF1918 domain-containing protein [Phytoactinopolyspora alkaliphila]
MQAHTGDHLVIEGAKVGLSRRDGEILETHGPNGQPPFLVRWADSGAEALVYPGPDAHVQPVHDNHAR